MDGDRYAEDVRIIADNLDNPNGVAVLNGDLFIAERTKISKIARIESRINRPTAPVTIYSDFPDVRSHAWKFLGAGPDGKLYVPQGAPCNICDPDSDHRRGKFMRIFRLNPDGSQLETFASGVRNTVGFDWHPVTGELWFTDNGRDSMGDDIPPDELNHAPRPGMHFGYPYCHGKNIRDPQFGRTRSRNSASITKPAVELGPHVAALGMRFYDGQMFPDEFQNQIFISEHGSWNRSKKIGYRVTVVRRMADGAFSYEPFAEGWLRPNDTRWGRPVDVLVMPDGSLLVSDDMAGVVYRISYRQ